ncbi:MAG TPA: hypothetical protein VGP87_02375 [Gemmatimonadales bacterium]|jgi:hypothetical protein|nr:hypothetical protein [Gemmatimonadales bacterium]
MRYLSLVLLGAALMSPVPGAAQMRAEFGPVFGYYRPYGSFDAASVYSTALPQAPKDLKGHAWGADARVWFGSRFGAELRGSLARSTIPSTNTPGGPSGATRADVMTVTAQGLLTLVGTPAQRQIWLSAGVGAIRHGGQAYQRYGTPMDVGPVVGGGARFGITRDLHATVGLSSLLYVFDIPMPPELSLNPGSLEHGRQIDVLVHFGITWMVGGH